MPPPQVETAEHRAAFDLYLSMGADRSLSEVARQLSKSTVAVAGWSSVFCWSQRIIEAEKRISDKASSMVEANLAKHRAQKLEVADKLMRLFLHEIDKAFNPDGTINTEAIMAYRPKAADVRLWAEVKDQILAADSGGSGAEIVGRAMDIGAMEMIGSETLERIIIERTTRLIAFRERLSKGGGVLGMGTRPGDPGGVPKQP